MIVRAHHYEIGLAWPFLFFVVSVSLVAMRLGLACYKGDPGYGGPDYPPSPPFDAKDAGKG